ncbi:DNA polymerase I [Lutimonas saemankumensis]|uniref:DNA polymerase I n=1 Tax=Lutimonas saemankumensis TaxID=483016 RepID=UPI001CD6A1CE|nr:DNA polymerase I [Lutimonas saemankumensis]MCA0932696.1 DNA polymerase I [Lutimonas saemankumensis]
MAEQKRLFLLDAYALIFRGYYAFIKNPRINSKGMDTSAIMGFTNSLLDVIKREKPDHLAVAFDKGGSQIRTEAFPEYKANRLETPEAIKIAVPYIHKILEAMHIPIIEMEGYEADDLIGTLSVQAEKAGYKTFMVTPDKDFAQLVTENVVMYRPARMGNGIEIWDVDTVKEKFEIEDPKQVIDFLGMMGDSVDNIPGLPGVGEKTAKKFLKAYGSMEGLFENTHELKGKMKEKVEANKELGLLSKELATIMLDCPVEFHEEDFELNTPDFNKVREIFQELEFRRSLENLNRIFQDQLETTAPPSNDENKSSEDQAEGHQLDMFSVPSGDTDSNTSISGYRQAENTDHLYQHVGTAFAQELLLKKLLQQPSVCFDTETTSLNTLEAKLVGIAFSFSKGKGYYVPVPKEDEEAREVLQRFEPFFQNESIEKVGQNLKYDLKVLKNYGVEIKGPIFDTMIAHYLINPDMRHNMNVLSETYLKYTPIPIENLIGKKGKNQGSMRDVSLELQTEYATEDADITWQLKGIFEKELESNGLTKLFRDIEIPLVDVLASMELEGIRLDEKYLKSLAIDLNKDIEHLENLIYTEADTDFNLASPKQLGVVLFEKLKLVDKPKKTKTGQYATGEEILSKLAADHEIVKNILEWRGLVKLKNTYVDSLPNEVNEKSGRVHTTYSQTVAATGRLSSNNPNLQNIPIRTERGQQVRKAFVPRDENYTLLAADYSQIELRLIAEMSGDAQMKESFLKGEDIHRSTAANVFNVPIEDVTREQRSYAKTVNFGIIYGVSAFGLSQQTDLSRSEARELIETYYETYPTLKSYIAKQVDFARDHGYVETILGRRRYLKNINSRNAIVRSADERNAVNAPIQGSAADIIKIAMIRIHELLKKENYRSKMLLQVHDELVFDMHKDELELLRPLIKNTMENAYKMSIPLTVDIGLGNDWLEAH